VNPSSEHGVVNLIKQNSRIPRPTFMSVALALYSRANFLKWCVRSRVIKCATSSRGISRGAGHTVDIKYGSWTKVLIHRSFNLFWLFPQAATGPQLTPPSERGRLADLVLGGTDCVPSAVFSALLFFCNPSCVHFTTLEHTDTTTHGHHLICQAMC
jgi:hypothetical protein